MVPCDRLELVYCSANRLAAVLIVFIHRPITGLWVVQIHALMIHDILDSLSRSPLPPLDCKILLRLCLCQL